MQNLFTRDRPKIVTSNRILYTPSTFARSSILHLQEIGELTALEAHTSKRANLSSFLFFMVVSGSGSLVYEGREYKLRPGCCVFIDCRRPYSHTTDEDLWTLRWIHFQGPTLSPIYEKYVERGGRPAFSPPDAEPFNQAWANLYDIAGSDDHIRDMRINEGLNALLTLLMEHSWDDSAPSPTAKKTSVIEVKAYLDENFAERITLDQLSRDFYINKFYLTRVFKEQFGVSITAYLQSVRITHAKQMLRFSDKSVEEIGLLCGLGQLNYFSRVFKQVEGVPPSVYRRQW